MDPFESAYKAVKQAEGGYVNHPNDNGGETYAGVARKFHPNWQGWQIIDRLKKQPGFPKSLDSNTELQALKRVFYYDNFWLKIGADRLKSPSFSKYLMDMAVLHGVSSALKLAQESIVLGPTLIPTTQEIHRAFQKAGLKPGVLCDKTIELFNKNNPV